MSTFAIRKSSKCAQHTAQLTETDGWDFSWEAQGLGPQQHLESKNICRYFVAEWKFTRVA